MAHAPSHGDVVRDADGADARNSSVRSALRAFGALPAFRWFIEHGARHGTGFRRPAIVVTAQRILDAGPSVVHVVPVTTAIRLFHSEVVVEPDDTNGLDVVSAAQCQHVRAVSPRRIIGVRGNVGPTVLTQLRETIAVILDLP